MVISAMLASKFERRDALLHFDPTSAVGAGSGAGSVMG